MDPGQLPRPWFAPRTQADINKIFVGQHADWLARFVAAILDLSETSDFAMATLADWTFFELVVICVTVRTLVIVFIEHSQITPICNGLKRY